MSKPTLVMVFGTFDFLHLGHIYTFQQAKALGDKLVVVISQDSSVEKIKGKAPFFSQMERKQLVESLKTVDVAIIGDKTDFFVPVRAYKPDVIALGYDQQVMSETQIRQKLNAIGLTKTKIVRLKPFQHNKHKSSSLKKFYGV